MILAAIHFGGWSWLLPAFMLAGAGLVLLWRSYRKTGGSRRVKSAAALLKAAGIVLLAMCLVNPLWSKTRVRPGANIFVLLADNSCSLAVRDNASSASRAEIVKELLCDAKATWQVRLCQDFDVRRYCVDDRLVTADDYSQLDFSGQSTRLLGAFDSLRNRLTRHPVAGVLLFTDGNATDFAEDRLDTQGLPPIYPVVVGERHGLTDVAIESITVNETSFEDAPVTIQAGVTVSGAREVEVAARLKDEQGRTVAEFTQRAGGDAGPAVFRFEHRPSRRGISFFRLQAAPAGAWEQLEQEQATLEATLENNQRMIAIDHGRRVQRILYVSGRPNWEFKFLNRAVAEDEAIELAALIRIAEREAKFDWRGRSEESSNPLYRGFKADADEATERYDEPVFVRLNMKDADELRDGFPITAERLYAFDAVILDDVAAGFFSHDQMRLLERYVSERGGGVLMLGGQKSFRAGDYENTPLAKMIPLYLGRGSGGARRGGYRLELTRDGWLQPWVRLRSTKADELARLQSMPEFRTINRLEHVKPGAAVLAHVRDSLGKSWPALIAQRYGRGRCAALTIGDLWRWQLRREDDSDDARKAWRQMLRWLVADVPHRIDVRVEPSPAAFSPVVHLQMRVRDETFQPLDNAAVSVTLTPPEGEPIRIDAEPSLHEPGLFEAAYVPKTSGGHRAHIVATNNRGSEVASTTAGWVHDPSADEFRSIVPNTVLMERLARETGGRVVQHAKLEKFVASLSHRPAPITEQSSYPLWHHSWVFLAMMACFAGEWGLRRWKGLP